MVLLVDRNRNVQSWGSLWLGKWKKFNFRHARVAQSCQDLVAVGKTLLEPKRVTWQMDMGKYSSGPCVCRLNHTRGYRQRREGSKEKISKVRRGRLVQEDQNNKRSYPVCVLDTPAGRGSRWGCWLQCTKAWQRESCVSQLRGQGVQISQFGWKIYVVESES